MWRGVGIGALIALSPLVAASPAGATTWCVKDPACPPGANSSQSTISGAVTAAASGGDTILIGPGTFVETVNTGGKAIDFTGVGSSRTIIRGPTPGTTVFSAGTGGTIRDLGIELPGGASTTGLFFNTAAERVAVTAAPGTISGTGVVAIGGTFDDGTVTLPTGPGTSTVGVSSFPAPSGAVQDSTIVASRGVVGVTDIERDRIFATQGIDELNSGPGGGSSTAFVVEDAAIRTVPGSLPEAGILAPEGSALGGAVGVSLSVRHATLVGSGGTSVGLSVSATAGGSNVNVNGSLSASIVRGYSTAISRTATGAGATAKVDLSSDYSDFNHAAVTSSNAGSPTGLGALTTGVHDVDVDPGFVTTAFTDPRAFRLLASSPVIDRGPDFLAFGESSTDLAGAPRRVAGVVFGTGFSDIGAFEFQPHAPSVTAQSPTAGIVKQPVTFVARGSDPDPGDALSSAWRFDDGTTASGAAVSHAFARPGRHTATVTVTDRALLSATASVSLIVLGRPALSHPTVAGGRLIYFDSAAARTTVTIRRTFAGARRGGRCVKTNRRVTGRRRCTIRSAVGRLTHADTSGRNAVPLRLHGRRLPAGSYELRLSARNAAGSSTPVTAHVRVRG